MFCAALTTAQFGSAFAQRAKLTRSGYEGLDTDGAITEAHLIHEGSFLRLASVA
jgi:hypothetical protein